MKAQQEVDHKAHQADPDSIEATFQERNYEVDLMVTEADFQRRLPCDAAPKSQCHVPMTTRCKIYSTAHAEALNRTQAALACLNLVSITFFRKADLLDVRYAMRLHVMHLTNTIDSYDRCRQRQLPFTPSHKQKLYRPENFNNQQCRDTSYGSAGRW